MLSTVLQILGAAYAAGLAGLAWEHAERALHNWQMAREWRLMITQ